jgi:hypothetical protein
MASSHEALLEQTFYGPGMERLGYPGGAFVSSTMERPFRGRIILPERGSPGRVLWECEHDHGSIPEAFQCAGEEAGRSGMT